MQFPRPLAEFSNAANDDLLSVWRVRCISIPHETKTSIRKLTSKLWRLSDYLPYGRPQVPKACKASACKLFCDLPWNWRSILISSASQQPGSFDMRQRFAHHCNTRRVAPVLRSRRSAIGSKIIERSLYLLSAPPLTHHLRDERRLLVVARFNPAAWNRFALRHGGQRRHRRTIPAQRPVQQRRICLDCPHDAFGHGLHLRSGLRRIEQPRPLVLSPPECQRGHRICRVGGIELEPLEHVTALPLLFLGRVGLEQLGQNARQGATQHSSQQRCQGEAAFVDRTGL